MRHSEQELLRVIDALYEGMLDESAWQCALVKLADLVSGSATALFSMNPSTGHVYRADVTRVDHEVMQLYGQTWINQDPRHAAALTCTIGQPQIDGMLVSPREFHRSAVFNEFYRPADIPYHIATWIERSPTRGVVLSVQGTWRRGAFTEEDRSRMAVLVPHVRRIVEMKDRLAGAHTTACAMLETMDRLPFGTLLLTQDWDILEASAPARSILARRSGIHADNGRLGFTRSTDERAFGQRLAEDPHRAHLDDALIITRPDSVFSLSLLVLPLKPSQEQWLRPTARWMVFVLDPELAPSLSERSLQHSLGITAAEAALARHIAHGSSLTEAARHLGISINTVRAQLKSIYAKTGENSQARLVKRILTSPAWMTASD